jgi:hypothetical protein
MLRIRLQVASLVLLAAVILVPGLAAVLTPAAGQTATGDKKPQVHVKWEYKALTDPDIEKLAPEGSRDKLTDGLNKLGDKGWELVTAVPGGRGGGIRFNMGGPGGPGAIPGGPGGMPGGPGMGMMAPPLTYVFKRPK